MVVTVGDIRKAVLGGGDVSIFAEFWHEVLGNPPVLSLPLIEQPVALPETTALLKHIDQGLESVVMAWLAGASNGLLPETDIDLTLIGVAPYGRNAGKYLERVVEEVRPDIIAIDTPPLGSSANMLYAFSIPCAVGLPVSCEILTKDSGQFYAGEIFYPGNVNEIALVKSWLAKTPLLPVGVPQKPRGPELGFMMGYVDDEYLDREMSKSSLLTAYRILDENLGCSVGLQEGTDIVRDICPGLMKTVGNRTRETLAEEACYIASRIMEIAAHISNRGKKTNLLAVVDITHYMDVEYTIDLMRQGVTDEVYVAPKSYAVADSMIMVGRDPGELRDSVEESASKLTFTQELFHRELIELIKTKADEVLPESEVDKLISEIVGRTRRHPDIARGASVRGTIALKEVLHGLAEMGGGLTRDSIGKAALITLPPRILVRPGYDETDVIGDIVKEILYGIRFSSARDEIALSTALDWLSPEEIMESLKNLKPLPPERGQEMARNNSPAVMAEPDKNQRVLQYLESRNFLRKERQGRYSFTEKALEHLLNELEQKFQAGDITLDEYNREKGRLVQMMKDASQSGFRMSAKELANTIMELMDAQDRQWSSEVSFDRMHIYYHIKASSEGEELDQQKRDYYGLKTLIDDLERQGILRTAERAAGFKLTSEALDILLDYLVTRDPGSWGIQEATDFGKALVNERNHETRRYTSGDVFRDISFRHTLREIARQKKALSDVRKGDFRVFMKQHRKQQSDIVLCLDISGSMGFRHKLMYARLAATGVAKAALGKGDRVGVVAFSNFGQTTIPLTGKDKDMIMDYIVGLSARGNTNIGDGIKCSSQLFSQDHSRNQKHIILITDGQPTAISQGVFDQLKALKEKDLSEESAMLETRKASAKGIRISVIHIADKQEASSGFIRSIVRVGKGKVHRISSSEHLRTIMAN